MNASTADPAGAAHCLGAAATSLSAAATKLADGDDKAETSLLAQEVEDVRVRVAALTCRVEPKV